MIDTFLPEQEALDNATHACDFPSEGVVERGGNAEDDATNCSIVEWVLVCDYHREKLWNSILTVELNRRFKYSVFPLRKPIR